MLVSDILHHWLIFHSAPETRVETNLKDFYFSAQNSILRYSDGLINMSIYMCCIHKFTSLYASGPIEAKLNVPKSPKYSASTQRGINFSSLSESQFSFI